MGMLGQAARWAVTLGLVAVGFVWAVGGFVVVILPPSYALAAFVHGPLWHGPAWLAVWVALLYGFWWLREGERRLERTAVWRRFLDWLN